MIVAAHAAEQPVRADPVARGLDEVGHRHTVRVCPRRFQREAPQQRPAGIGELEQREIGRDVRDRLRDREQEERQASGDQPIERAQHSTQPDLFDRPPTGEP